MIYLAILLIALSACGEAPIGPSSPYERIETFAGTGDAGKGPEEPTLRQALFYLPQVPTGGSTSSTGTTTASAWSPTAASAP